MYGVAAGKYTRVNIRHGERRRLRPTFTSTSGTRVEADHRVEHDRHHGPRPGDDDHRPRAEAEDGDEQRIEREDRDRVVGREVGLEHRAGRARAATARTPSGRPVTTASAPATTIDVRVRAMWEPRIPSEISSHSCHTISLSGTSAIGLTSPSRGITSSATRKAATIPPADRADACVLTHWRSPASARIDSSRRLSHSSPLRRPNSGSLTIVESPERGRAGLDDRQRPGVRAPVRRAVGEPARGVGCARSRVSASE